MRHVDIFYLYEHIDRELDVACIVHILAARRHGLRVEIVQHPLGQLSHEFAIDGYYPRVVALPHAYYTPYLLDWPKSTYVSLMWEQLFYKGNEKWKRPQGKFALQHLLHHAWGDFAAAYLESLGVPGSHIFANGNPAYALYLEPYRRYYANRQALAARHNLDPAKRWIFFPENYNWAFYTEEKLNASQAQSGFNNCELYALRDFCNHSMAQVVQWCAALAQDDRIEIILRPRPYVPLDEFVAAARQAAPQLPPRLHITKAETVREWILASDVVVSSYSTSLIEAAVAGKPAFMLTPLPLPELVHMQWHDLTPCLRTQAEFERACLAPVAPDARLRDWAFSSMLRNGDPIERLATFLSDVATGRRAGPAPVDPKHIPLPERGPNMLPPAFVLAYHQWVRRYQHWRVRTARRPVTGSSHFEKDLVSRAEIEKRISRWSATLSAAGEPAWPAPG